MPTENLPSISLLAGEKQHKKLALSCVLQMHIGISSVREFIYSIGQNITFVLAIEMNAQGVLGFFSAGTLLS